MGPGQDEGLKRVRISSIEASQIDDRILEVLNTSEKMCRHLHIPLQAGDDEVLKRMRQVHGGRIPGENRGIRKAMPQVAITTVCADRGFPGETDEQFENSYRLIEELQFAELHVFPYSKRTGTPAARMENQVPDAVKQERVQRLIQLSNRLSLEYARQFVGDVLDVIPERPYKEAPGNGLYTGYSDNYLQLVFPGNEELLGKVCRVRPPG